MQTIPRCFLLLITALLWLPSVRGFAQPLLLTLDDPTPQEGAFFGRAVAGVGDVDGDSVPDIAVVASCQHVGTFTNQGQAFVFSGADGSLLLTLSDPFPQAQTPDCLFGHALWFG
jgi:hypothetical protein